MKFSVVIPVYGTEKFLPRCLESIRAQTESDCEVIVVDDCSPGGCADVVRPFGSFVRYVRQDRNRGCFQARVTGLRHTTGDYVVPLDPDDWLRPDALAKIGEAIGRGPVAPDLVSFGICCDDGRSQRDHWCQPGACRLSAVEYMEGIADGRLTWSIVSKAVKRSVYLQAMDRLGSSRDVYVNTSEDFFSTLPILLCANTVSILDYVGYVYFQNRDSISATRTSLSKYRRAGEETRTAHETVRRMAAGLVGADEKRLAMERVIARCEKFFVEEALQGPVAEIPAKVEILADVFHPQSVVQALADEYVTLKTSRAYRFGNLIAQVPRAIRSCVGSLFGRLR